MLILQRWSALITGCSSFNTCAESVRELLHFKSNFSHVDRALSYCFAHFSARMECDWAAYNAVIAEVQAIKDRNQQMAAAVAKGFPARISLVQNVSVMMYDLMATVSFRLYCL